MTTFRYEDSLHWSGAGAASVRYGLTDAPSGGLTMVDPPLLSQ